MATIGTDPEFFVRDENYCLIPACGLLGGTKNEPRPLPGLPAGFGVQEDNVMVELTVPPCLSANGLVEAVVEGKNAINALLAEHGCALYDDFCEYEFSRDALDRHAGSTIFGCSPDFDAYADGAQRTPLNHARVGRWRFSGGHIHIGGDFGPVPKHVIAMFCDLAMGLYSTMHDHQNMRRRFYGAAGVFRPTPYGIEYRTMSNWWATNSNSTRHIGQRGMRMAKWLEQSSVKDIRAAMLSVNWPAVRTAITEGNAANAEVLMREYQGVMA